MKRLPWLLGAVACMAVLPGCVERRYVIYSDPPGAVVLRNGQPIGQTPVDDHYVYYGNYHFTLIKEGFETQQIDQKIAPPWYEYFPLEFVSENLIPWTIKDRRTFTYQLQPRLVPNPANLLSQAENLRNRGRSIGAGTPPAAAAAVPAPAPNALATPPVMPPAP
jgi:hypothetical protein